MSRLLPRFTVSSHADQLKVDKAVGTANAADVDTINDGNYRFPVDKRGLRGIPVVGFTGTSPGTDPLQALIDKESELERQTRRMPSDL